MADSNRRQRRLLLSTLDSTRLSDLVASLVFPAAAWLSLRRASGRSSPSDPEFIGREDAGKGVQRTWWIKINHAEDGGGASLAQSAIAMLGDPDRIPDVLLMITTSDVSQAAIEELRHVATQRGINHVSVWARVDLEKRLYAERPDLLFAYFGVSSFKRWHLKVRGIRRRVQLKQRMTRDFVKPAVARPRSASRPFEKFKHAKLILRSIDDDSYPEIEARLGIARGWFEVSTYDFYHDGIEVILSSVDVALSEEETWAPIPVGFAFDAERYKVIRAFEVGRVPYDHIVDYDLTGDEFYRQPHMFCLFAASGLPFAEYRYYAVEEPYRVRLNPKKMVDLGSVSSDSAETMRSERRRAT
ncbi:MAG: hypothetical protein ACT4P6_01120 [Gemmatimonadaceae bacterium]